MKLRKGVIFCLVLAILLSCCFSSCTKDHVDEPELLTSPEEARMIELWDMTLELAAMSDGGMTLTNIQTNMVDEPLDKVVTDGVWDELTYASGESVSHWMGREKPLVSEGGTVLAMPEYFSPLEVDSLAWRLHLPNASVVAPVWQEDALPELGPSQIVYDVTPEQVRCLRVKNDYFIPFVTGIVDRIPQIAVGIYPTKAPPEYDGLSADMCYVPSTDTLTLLATWTANTYYGCGIVHELFVTVAPDAQNAGKMTLTWEYTQTEDEAVPYSSVVPEWVSVGSVTEWVTDGQGLVSCTVREERTALCVAVELLGCTQYTVEAKTTVQTRLTPRDSTVLSQTVTQRTEKHMPVVGVTGSDATLTTVITDRGDGTYDFRMNYDVYRDSADRYFYAVMTR